VRPAVLGALLAGCGSGGVSEIRRQVGKVVPAVEKAGAELTREKVPCEPAFKTPTPSGCSIQSLTCGSVVEGSTVGQGRRWGDDFYQSAFCTPYRHAYEEGPEAVYRLEVPANIQADVRLDSDCAELDVVSMSWTDTSSCPTLSHTTRIRECEMDTHDGGGSIRMTTVNDPQVYLLAVDGQRGEEGNFRLTVTCRTYR
jgi:hypothetical protein